MRRPIVLVALIVLLAVAVVFGYSRLNPPKQAGQPTAPLPAEIEGLKLVELLTGEQAVNSINKLHGTSIAIVNGYVATYQKDQDKLVVWIAEASDEQKARELLITMARKMEGSNVFSRPERFTINGKDFYYSVGAGMSNYFYVKGAKVYWIGVASEDEMNIVQKAIHSL